MTTRYHPAQGKKWQCPRCGVSMKRGDAPRDGSGRLAKHCGCRSGVHPRLGYVKHANIGVQTRSADYKRMARVMALPGFTAVKHDAHVAQMRAYARAQQPKRVCLDWLTVDERQERRKAQQRRLTDTLSDSYVSRRLKKNMPALVGVKLPQSLIDLERLRLLLLREIANRR